MTKVDNIIKAYANDLDGKTYQECRDADFSAKQCGELEKALGTGAEGIITPEEKTELEQVGFAKDFIQDLVGTDGKKALQLRVRWLSEHLNTKWYRIDYDLHERMDMGEELTEIGPDAKAAIPVLIDTIKNKQGDLLCWAPYILGKIGPDAKDSVPALIEAIGDHRLGTSAGEALVGIGKEAVPALIDALKNKDKHVRTRVLDFLYQIGKQAFFAIPVLEKMVVDDLDPECRRVAQLVLNKMMEEIR